MRYALTWIGLMFGTAASAHPGHLIEAAGHDHWLAAGALAAAAAIALAVLVAKARARAGEAQDDEADTADADDASQEA